MLRNRSNGGERMTLQQLRYVIEVSEMGSMSEAAKRLFISQPSLSNAIMELEKEIGIQIFIRTNKGIQLSVDGTEFLGYARQVIEQMELLEQKYVVGKPHKQKFSISTQHYSFAVKAFVDLIMHFGMEEYDFAIRETRTYEIIEDVRMLKSEIGILYLSNFNEKVITKLIKENELDFELLFIAQPHIFVSSKNPLVKKYKEDPNYNGGKGVTLEDLEDFPVFRYDQGVNNSFYFTEEILSTLEHKKSIMVNDRATLFNLLIGLNGYTISTGVISEELNGKDIISLPLDVDEIIRVGMITHKNTVRSRLGEIFISRLKENIKNDGLT